jgi:hypothetical protein
VSYIHSTAPHLCYMSCQSHLPSFYRSNCTRRKVQGTNLVIMQFPPTSHHFTCLRSKYLPRHPVLRHPQLTSNTPTEQSPSLNVVNLLIKMSPHFMELLGSLPCPRESVAGLFVLI